MYEVNFTHMGESIFIIFGDTMHHSPFEFLHSGLCGCHLFFHSHPSAFCHLIFIISFLVKVKTYGQNREKSTSCFVIFYYYNSQVHPINTLVQKRIMNYYSYLFYSFKQIFFSFLLFFIFSFLLYSFIFSLQD